MNKAKFKSLYRALRLARGQAWAAMQNLPCGADDALGERAEEAEEAFLCEYPCLRPAAERWDTDPLTDRAADFISMDRHARGWQTAKA